MGYVCTQLAYLLFISLNYQYILVDGWLSGDMYPKVLLELFTTGVESLLRLREMIDGMSINNFPNKAI
jgi:hypothetical protein